MAARVADRLRDIGDIVKLIEEWSADMNRVLTFTLSALMLSAPALAQTAPPERKMYDVRPIGEGDPSGISCYPEPSSFSRVKKMDCRSNAEWASIDAAVKRNSSTDIGNRAGGAPVNVIPH